MAMVGWVQVSLDWLRRSRRSDARGPDGAVFTERQFGSFAGTGAGAGAAFESTRRFDVHRSASPRFAKPEPKHQHPWRGSAAQDGKLSTMGLFGLF